MSEIGFGSWAIGGNVHGNSYGPTDDGASRVAVAKALEMGCNFFDTADVYGNGHSEELLGGCLKGVRDKVFIATKVGGDFYSGYTRMNFSAQYIRFALEKSLQRLQTEWVDLYQLHNPSLALIQEGKVFEAMVELKREGKIRAIGVSISNPEEGVAAITNACCDSLQVVFSLLRREALKDLFPLVKKHGVAIVAREPLMNGFLTGKFLASPRFFPGDIREGWPPDYVEMTRARVEKLRFLAKSGRTLSQAALKFALSDPAVSTTIPGCKSEQQVVENLGASDAPDLSAQELKQSEQGLMVEI